MGTSRYLKEQNPKVQIVGLQPEEARPSPASVAGRRPICRRSTRPAAWIASSTWGQQEAEDTMRRLAREECIFCGVSSGGSVAGALRIAGKWTMR